MTAMTPYRIFVSGALKLAALLKTFSLLALLFKVHQIVERVSVRLKYDHSRPCTGGSQCTEGAGSLGNNKFRCFLRLWSGVNI